MQIQNIQSKDVKFQGYDARKIKALCLGTTHAGVAKELDVIGEKIGFDVFVITDEKIKTARKLTEEVAGGWNFWAQDIAIFTPLKSLLSYVSYPAYSASIGEHFKAPCHYRNTVPTGGNLFFIKDKAGRERLLIGQDEKTKVDKLQNLREILGVENVDVIPQMDFHIDMFLRPLEGKKVLIADDSMTLEVMKKSLEKVDSLIAESSNILRKFYYKKIHHIIDSQIMIFKNALETNKCAKLPETEKALKSLGYETIRVPGRLYTIASDEGIRCKTNFMNAIITKNNDGELIYITNKSFYEKGLGLEENFLKQIGFDLENAFIESVSPYIKRENIYFIEGGKDKGIQDLLENRLGGVHCLVTEIV